MPIASHRMICSFHTQHVIAFPFDQIKYVQNVYADACLAKDATPIYTQTNTHTITHDLAFTHTTIDKMQSY